MAVFPNLAALHVALPEDAGNVARELDAQGLAFLDNNQLNEALACFEQAEPIWLSILGPTHPDMMQLYADRADLLEQMHRKSEALIYYQRAECLMRLVHGPTHVKVSYSMRWRALLHKDLEQYHEALALLEQAVWEREIDLRLSYRERAEVLQFLGRFEEALPLAERAVQMYRIDPNPDWGPSSLSIAIFIQVNLLHALRRFEEARPLLAEAQTLLPRHQRI